MPSGFRPRPADGEVGAFQLVSPRELLQRVRSPSRYPFLPSALLACVDLLCRLGHIAPDDDEEDDDDCDDDDDREVHDDGDRDDIHGSESDGGAAGGGAGVGCKGGSLTWRGGCGGRGGGGCGSQEYLSITRELRYAPPAVDLDWLLSLLPPP